MSGSISAGRAGRLLRLRRVPRAARAHRHRDAAEGSPAATSPSVRVLAVLAVDPRGAATRHDPRASPGPRPASTTRRPASGSRPAGSPRLVSARPVGHGGSAERHGTAHRPAGGREAAAFSASRRRAGRPAPRGRSAPAGGAGRLRPSAVHGLGAQPARPARRHDDDGICAAALHTAAAQDVLDGLPSGLDDEVNERGRSLSGGQRQRLSLARACSPTPRRCCWSSRPARSTRTPRP